MFIGYMGNIFLRSGSIPAINHIDTMFALGVESPGQKYYLVKGDIMKIELIPISEIIPYENNIKEHPQEQVDKLKESIKEFDFNDPISIDENNVILEGHGRFMALKQLGEKEAKVIKIKHLNELQKKKYRIYHNQLTMSTGFNVEKLKLELDAINIDLGEIVNVEIILEDLGFSKDDIKNLGLTEEEKEELNNYSKKIKAPIYEPKNEKPELKDLFSNEKYNELVNDIEKSKIPKKEKEFLKLAATRHIVFNYENIADYYSHSKKENQELFENSALVIIDFEKAIENGYIQLDKNIKEQFEGETNE